ncbi:MULTISPECIES: DUF4870 domain-containing protein [Bremerella]|uniref:DUF4870 domain-containing protein n=1 Tax=Bremerella TaxID=2714594 RepID=UPI0031E5C204
MSTQSSFSQEPPHGDFTSSMEEPSQDDRNIALLCHILGFFTWIVGPVVLWLLMKEKSSFIDFHGKQAINFQITLSIFYIGSGVLFCVYIGILTFLATFVLQIVFTVLACMKAYEGDYYNIPVAIPILR